MTINLTGPNVYNTTATATFVGTCLRFPYDITTLHVVVVLSEGQTSGDVLPPSLPPSPSLSLSPSFRRHSVR